MAEPLRVTTNPEYFEDQPSSLELWSPGSPLFPGEEGTPVENPRRLAEVLDTGAAVSS